jgi:hypothetical protein
LQVEILCQYRLDIGHIGVVIHRSAQFDDATELVTTLVVGVCESKLCVVLCRHGSRLRLRAGVVCEPKHKFGADLLGAGERLSNGESGHNIRGDEPENGTGAGTDRLEIRRRTTRDWPESCVESLN